MRTNCQDRLGTNIGKTQKKDYRFFSPGGDPCESSAGRIRLRKNGSPFLSCPYVCPEPVLAKCSHLYIHGSKRPFLLTAIAHPKPSIHPRISAVEIVKCTEGMLLERAAGAVHQTDWCAAAAAWVRARRGPRVETRATWGKTVVLF
jgi:hypothetical protein